jgi:hypothetical protein
MVLPLLSKPRHLTLDVIRRTRDTPVWKLDAGAEMSVFAACSHDQADDAARDHAVFLGASW